MKFLKNRNNYLICILIVIIVINCLKKQRVNRKNIQTIIIIRHAEKRDTSIAFETEGSFLKKEHLLMQRPEEYKELFKIFSPKQIGISLNIGHLILAAKAFNFIIEDFINLIEDYIVSMELSHNNGIEDEHLPLRDNGWYWNLILDKRFNNSFKILEFRNTQIKDIKKTIKLFELKKKKYG